MEPPAVPLRSQTSLDDLACDFGKVPEALVPGHPARELFSQARLIASVVSLAVACLLVAPRCGGAQGSLASHYTMRSWQTEHGLPQNSVTAILQARDGYLWLGTFNGLVRFDGVGFVTHNLANAPEMGSDSVVCLFEDRQGRLWVGTDSGGLACYAEGRFTNYVATNGPGATTVSTVAEDAQGTIWVGTDGGLFRLESGRLAPCESPVAPDGFGVVRHLFADARGQMWIAAESGVFLWSEGECRRLTGYEDLTRLGAGTEGDVWLFNSISGLVRCLPVPSGEVVVKRADWSGDLPRCLAPTRSGALWCGGSDGLARIQKGEVTRYSLPESWGVNSVLAIYEDREGNLWVGTNGAGLLCLRETALETVATRQGLPDNDVVVMMQQPPGRVWIGGFTLGVGVWENGRFVPLPGLPGFGQDVYALARDRDGRVWVGTRAGRLLGWREGRVVVDEPAPNEGARVLFVDREGDLWVGGRNGGVERRGRDGGRTRYSPATGLSDGYVTAIVQDSEGAMWVGTRRGLNRIHHGGLSRFYREHGLGSDCVHSLLVDKRGVLWVGTVGGGLGVRLAAGRFASLGAAHGLANEVIGQILEDDNGALWLGSNGGILRVSREELLACASGARATVHCRTFGRREGMSNPECAGGFQPSCFRARDGRLWFATVGGAVIVDPERLGKNALPPPVVVTSVSADGVGCRLANSIAGPLRARVPPGTARVQVHYSGLSFVAPEDMRFQVRLEGLDADWIDAGSRREASLDRLSPGLYSFRVRACNSDGVWNEEGARLWLEVEPFWWQTSWFRSSASASVFLATLGLAWRTHTRRLGRALELAERRSAGLRAAELGTANRNLQARAQELESALANVRTLSGLIPICAGCKKVRDDKGYWEQVELYVSRHSEARFSHGLCPGCAEEYFPGLDDGKPPAGG